MTLKVIYANVVSSALPGVVKKIERQARDFNQLGSDIKVVCFVPYGDPLKSSYFEVVKLPKFKPRTANIFIPKILAEFFHCRSPDVVVLRYIHQTPFFWFFFRNKNYKLILEYHGLMKEELKLRNRKFLFALYCAFRRLCDSTIDGKIAVTNEIALSEEGHGVKTRVIPNGTDITSIPIRSYTVFNGKFISMVFVGSQNQEWHGLDRILNSLTEWKRTARIDFCLHIIGDINIDNSALSSLSDNIVLHGYLSGERFNRVFDSVHVGFSSVSLHRLNMKDACTLKSREYLARGLPFIYGYTDPDFSETFEYALSVPNDESLIRLDSVVDFLLSIEEKETSGIDTTKEIREYAALHVDNSVKNTQVIEFVRGVSECVA